jgi:hypothetical protein
MRIKAWVVTGAAAVLASTALGVLVTAHDPYVSGTGVRVLFWLALAISAWGIISTATLALRLNLMQAVGLGALSAVASSDFRAAVRIALLGGVILVTLVASVLIWRLFRNG